KSGDPPARSAAVGETQKFATKADREHIDGDTAPPRHQEMAELMDKHDESDDEQERRETKDRPGKETAECSLHEYQYSLYAAARALGRRCFTRFSRSCSCCAVQRKHFLERRGRLPIHFPRKRVQRPLDRSGNAQETH